MIPRLATPAWLVCLLALGTGAPAAAAMYLVPSEYATIQAAVDAAASGDSVLVAPGVFPEAVVITGKYLYLIGAASDSVTSSEVVDVVNSIFNSAASPCDGCTSSLASQC